MKSKSYSERFSRLVENCRAIAWNHPMSFSAEGWNDACIATGDRSFASGYCFKDEIVEIYRSYNLLSLRVVSVKSGNPTTAINEYGKVIQNDPEQWKLEDHINALAAETPTVKKAAFFSHYFRHICLHVQPSATSSYSVEIRETSEGKVVIEDIRGIDRKEWDKVAPKGLEKVALLYSELAKVMENFDKEHKSLINQGKKEQIANVLQGIQTNKTESSCKKEQRQV